jgi:hypothetical protein
MNDHCVLDYTHQPPVFRCIGCGDIHEVKLPMPFFELVKLSDQFGARHRACRPRPHMADREVRCA